VPQSRFTRASLTVFVSFAVTALVWRNAAFFVPSADPIPSDEVFYGRAVCRLTVLLVGSFVAAFALVPGITGVLIQLRRRSSGSWTYLTLAAACLFQWIFILHYGRWQFGAFDFSNLMQEGWREHLGQHAYTDFLASTPPVFNLGIKYAYQFFGVTWDANLYLTALFTCATFLWMYWLFTRLSVGRVAAIAVAFAIEVAAMLTLSFWWYNNVTTILAAILFLSSLVYVARPRDLPAQLSFVLSLTLCSLAKPNMAGLTIFSCVLMLLLAGERRVRTLLLTMAAAVLAVAVLLLNHISIAALLHSYRSVARERGFGAVGWSQMNPYEQYSSLLWIPLLSLPLFARVPHIVTQFKQHQGRPAILSLFFLIGPAIAAYGVATNGEIRQVECTLLLAGGAVVAFGLRLNRPMVTRLYIALLAASITGDLYQAAIRLRIYYVGPHQFFEWQDNRNLIAAGPLKNMRVSSTMIGVEDEIEGIVKQGPGPFWFGPRLDFNNAVFHLPMPEHLAAWWHPGTAFPRSDVPRLLGIWQQQRYQTLIFLRTDPFFDYIYYPPPFLDILHRDYTADDTLPSLTVYRLRRNSALHP
jgi:hypothetical protein